MSAFLFDNLNLPACEEVTAIYVDVLARFTAEDGGIRLQVRTDSGLQLGPDFRSCFSSGGNGNCRWRFNSSSSPQGVNILPFFEAAGLGVDDISTLDLDINRVTNPSQCSVATDNLLVKAFRIVVESQVRPFEVFCTPPNLNASNKRTLLTATGSASKTASSLIMNVLDAPPNQNGIIIWGRGGVPAFPSGRGNVCIANPIMRTTQALSTGDRGNIAQPVTFQSDTYSMIQAGETVYFQFWHRDPAGPPTTRWNYSDGVKLTVCP